MVTEVPKRKGRDFSALQCAMEDYAEQEEISNMRVQELTACAVHFGLDFGLVAWYLGGEYTRAWCNAPEILAAAAPHVEASTLEHMRRILTKGCPAKFNWEEPAKNKQAFLERGNNPSVAKYQQETDKTMNKEEHNSHVMAFMRFVVTFSAFGRATPQHMRVQRGKKPRLIWDGKNKLRWNETTMNEVTGMEGKAAITFGLVYMAFCTWLYNLRVSYADQDIYTAFIDITACFRFPRIFADLVWAFGFVIGPLFFAANAMVIGSVTSASSWEPFRTAIAAMATAYFYRAELVERLRQLLDMPQWTQLPEPDTQFAKARACSKNRGVFNVDGTRMPTPHCLYVDDNLLVDVREYLPRALTGAAEAIFTIMERSMPQLRQVALSLEKWEKLVVAPRNVLLGLQLDTRAMTVGITDEYRAEVTTMLEQDWPSHCTHFTVGEMERMVGKLGRIGQGFRPIYHMMPHMYGSVAYALCDNERFLNQTSRRFCAMVKRAKARPIPDIDEDEREIGQVAKQVHKCDQAYKMPESLKQEIDFAKKLLNDSHTALTTSLGHIVDRDPEFEA
ncbi:hypothetical protein ACHAWF_001576 [Thalassiosira exigua]